MIYKASYQAKRRNVYCPPTTGLSCVFLNAIIFMEKGLHWKMQTNTSLADK